MRLSAPDFKTYILRIVSQFPKIWHKQKRWVNVLARDLTDALLEVLIKLDLYVSRPKCNNFLTESGNKGAIMDIEGDTKETRSSGGDTKETEKGRSWT